MIDWKGMLREASEPKYAKFSSSLIPGRDDIIGVRVPTIRKIAKDVLKDDWRSVVSDTPSNFEEQMVLAIVIAAVGVGLGVPEAARLCQLLREKGVDLPSDLYTQEELHEHLLRLWKEANPA